MAIKGGQILTDVNGYVIDRLQTAGPGSLNIPEEKIRELGNYQTVAIVRDIPDMSWDCESFDVSTEFESRLLNATPHAGVIGDSPATIVGSTAALHEFDFRNAVPIDVISPYKSLKNHYDIVKGVATPYLTLERASYRFGVRQSSSQQFQLKGDSIYYIPGVPYYETNTYDPTASHPLANTFTFPGHNGSTPAALLYREQGQDVFALCLTLINPGTGASKRLFHGSDYTDSSAGFTITAAHPGYSHYRVTYGGTGTKDYLQSVHDPATANSGVKPAAVRGKDIDVYIGNTASTPTFTKFRGVQSAEATWSVSLENDEELGNHHYVSQTYEIPDVTGSIAVKPEDVGTLFDQITKITSVTAGQVIGPNVTVPVPLEIRVNDPAGSLGVLKTIYVPDARFKVPGAQGRANTKLETTFEFTSDTGIMYVYDGARGGAEIFA